jgi:DNA-binding CsgD family transcriptional regulator
VSETGGEFPRRLATPWLVMALVEQARRAEAEQLLDSAGMLGSIPPNLLLTAILGSRGRLRLAQGDAARAVEDLAGACERNKAWARAPLEPPWRPLLVEALVLADRVGEAKEEATSYTARATEWGTRRGLGHAARMRALVAPRTASITLLEEARAHLAASNARLELARCLVELGTRHRASGERRAARAILRDAHDAAYVCGATALCEQARAELLLAGGRPRPPVGAGAASLTPAERRVAELAAEGAANRDIARRLYLSPKTIEMHLRSAYRKLDIPGRGYLAAALR